ncbi:MULTISPECIES: hypothetical protein [Aeromonas]|uniref:hypothetical protein n=1 Tax=Aeromonas TaxID=642 RepID=UPI00228580AB|nr:hypothetical protein [Aeromonas enteropelogenes]MCZ0752549.1 hypothetical protein [Aeromonas enteropelogenes]
MDKDEHEKMVKQVTAEIRAERHKEEGRQNKNFTLAMVIGLFVSPFAFHAMFDTGYYMSALLGLCVAVAINYYLK